MPRKPQPGSDEGTWGDILNEYLAVAHNADGTLKNGIVTAAVLSAPAPGNGQVLSYDGSGLSWATPSSSGSVPDATPTVKGLVQLAGDLGGTSASPTVPGLASKADSSALTAHTSSTANPHSVTKAQVGLANADNTSDANKPISTATQTALNAKANTTHTHAAADIASGTIAAARLGSGTASSSTYLRGDGTWATPAGGGGTGVTAVARTSAYTANAGEFVIADATSGGFTVTLPAAVNGSTVSVKKVDVTVNAVLIVPPAGQIDDQASVSVNSQWQSQDFFSDGTKWYRV